MQKKTKKKRSETCDKPPVRLHDLRDPCKLMYRWRPPFVKRVVHAFRTIRAKCPVCKPSTNSYEMSMKLWYTRLSRGYAVTIMRLPLGEIMSKGMKGVVGLTNLSAVCLRVHAYILPTLSRWPIRKLLTVNTCFTVAHPR